MDFKKTGTAVLVLLLITGLLSFMPGNSFAIDAGTVGSSAANLFIKPYYGGKVMVSLPCTCNGLDNELLPAFWLVIGPPGANFGTYLYKPSGIEKLWPKKNPITPGKFHLSPKRTTAVVNSDGESECTMIVTVYPDLECIDWYYQYIIKKVGTD